MICEGLIGRDDQRENKWNNHLCLRLNSYPMLRAFTSTYWSKKLIILWFKYECPTNQYGKVFILQRVYYKWKVMVIFILLFIRDFLSVYEQFNSNFKLRLVLNNNSTWKQF